MFLSQHSTSVTSRTLSTSLVRYCTKTQKQQQPLKKRPPKNPKPSPPLINTESGGNSFALPPNYFSYGAPDFGKVRDQQQFLVDKTQYIPLVEASGDHLLFLRPPRWGKSQHLTMLQCYYDIEMKSKFRGLFGDLFIGKKPTSLRNSFHVLPLDFSIDVTGGTQEIKQNLHNHVNCKLKGFLNRYNLKLDLNPCDSFSNLQAMAEMLASNQERLLILVDEYDRFANKLMLENPEGYTKIFTGITGDPASSPIRSFYETLKSIHGLRGYRTISMGLTPISLADASGANYMKNISHKRSFGDMVGFTQSDLRRALSDINIIDARADTLLDVMTRFYNGYRFFGSSQPLYNSTLCLYFLEQLTIPEDLDKILRFASTPSPSPAETADFTNMIMDNNVQISENVLHLISRSPVDVPAIISTLLNTATPITTIDTFPQSFKIREMLGVLTDSDKIIVKTCVSDCFLTCSIMGW